MKTPRICKNHTFSGLATVPCALLGRSSLSALVCSDFSLLFQGTKGGEPCMWLYNLNNSGSRLWDEKVPRDEEWQIEK